MQLSTQHISSILNANPITGGANYSLSIPLTDSRSLLDPEHTLFFALTTSSNDGHRYVRELYRRGVRNFVINSGMLSKIDIFDDANFFFTDGPVLDALQATATAIRNMVTCPIIGVTGSRGKTVVKEMLADAITDRRITKSPRSWNSQIGVPLSIWQLEPDTELGIFEAGISRPGEMHRLSDIIRPTIGIFTDLTDEHQGEFESLEHKCREKAQLFNHCTDIIYLSDEPIIRTTLENSCSQAHLHPASDYTDIVNIAVSLLHSNRSSEQVETKQCREQNSEITPASTSISTRIDISDGGEGNIIAFDRYSNDLGGIETALDQLARRIPADFPLVVVLGDLLTRGWDPDIVYQRLEQLLLDRNVDEVIAVGETISRYVAGFSDLLRKGYATSGPAEFIERFNTHDFPHSSILIKGTPREQFEKIKNWLEDTLHYTCLEVNLDALINNFNYYRSMVKPTTGMIGMVKADAYGAGAVEIARTLQSQGADYLAVAVVEEGLELRRAGISMPVMVLNPISSNYSSLFTKKLEPTIFSLRELEMLSSFAPKDTGTPYPVHIKLDTGMHRFGFSESQLPRLVEEIRQYPQFRVASIFSHLATADSPSMNDYTEYQLANFERMSSYLIQQLGYPIKRHILNTAGIMRYPRYQYDLVRLGIGLYGISPLDQPDPNLKPVSSLVTIIGALQLRHQGETVGYSRRGVISRESTIATLPIGYADGLNRHLGNGTTSMYVNGTMCPTVGNICMDICMIDVTDVSDPTPGQRVEIFGEHIPVTSVARSLDTIPYEILTSISPRVKRIYFRE